MNSDNSKIELSNVAEIVMGQSPSGDTYNKIGKGFPLLNGPTEFGSSYPTPALWTTEPTRFCQERDILFCVRGSTTGRMNWADRKYCIGRGIGAIRGKNGVTDTRFIYYTLVHNLPRLLSLCSGSVFPNLSRQDLGSFEIEWFDEYTRLAIAHILGTLDDKIELNQQMNRNLEAITSAIFKSWFVDFDPVRAKMEGLQPVGMDAATAALFPNSFEDSSLGEIPKGWEIAPIGNYVDAVKGLSYKGSGLSDGHLEKFIRMSLKLRQV
jgi:type I restriction enzyme S subunit